MYVYTLVCGCVRCTNRNTSYVRKGIEMSGVWALSYCDRHSDRTLSNYEKSLAETLLKP